MVFDAMRFEFVFVPLLTISFCPVVQMLLDDFTHDIGSGTQECQK